MVNENIIFVYTLMTLTPRSSSASRHSFSQVESVISWMLLSPSQIREKPALPILLPVAAISRFLALVIISQSIMASSEWQVVMPPWALTPSTERMAQSARYLLSCSWASPPAVKP